MTLPKVEGYQSDDGMVYVSLAEAYRANLKKRWLEYISTSFPYSTWDDFQKFIDLNKTDFKNFINNL